MWFKKPDLEKRHRKELKQLFKRLSQSQNNNELSDVGVELSRRLSENDTWIVEPMIQLFKSGSDNLKAYIADAFVKLLVIIKDDRVPDILVAELLSPDGYNSLAAKILGKARCQKAIDPIVTAMLSCSDENKYYLVRFYAQALADIGCSGNRVDDAIVHILKIVYNTRYDIYHKDLVSPVVNSTAKLGGSKTVLPLCAIYSQVSSGWHSSDFCHENEVHLAFVDIEDRIGRLEMLKLLLDELHIEISSRKSQFEKDTFIGAAILLDKMGWEPESEVDKSLLKTGLELCNWQRQRAKGYRDSAG